MNSKDMSFSRGTRDDFLEAKNCNMREQCRTGRDALVQGIAFETL